MKPNSKYNWIISEVQMLWSCRQCYPSEKHATGIVYNRSFHLSAPIFSHQWAPQLAQNGLFCANYKRFNWSLKMQTHLAQTQTTHALEFLKRKLHTHLTGPQHSLSPWVSPHLACLSVVSLPTPWIAFSRHFWNLRPSCSFTLSAVGIDLWR